MNSESKNPSPTDPYQPPSRDPQVILPWPDVEMVMRNGPQFTEQSQIC